MSSQEEILFIIILIHFPISLLYLRATSFCYHKQNLIQTSAKKDIADTFEGSFKEQSSINSNWMPVNNAKVRKKCLLFGHEKFFLRRVRMLAADISIYHKIALSINSDLNSNTLGRDCDNEESCI